MKLSLPEFLIGTCYEEAKLGFKWNSNIEDKITTVPPQKIADAVVKLNHKAMMGLTVALSELAFWRLHHFYEKDGENLSDYIDFVEAAWASLIDKRYLSVEVSAFEYDGGKAEEVIFTVDWLFRAIANGYIRGSYFMQQGVANIAAIVRLISPQPELFDAWLIGCLEKSIEFFPTQYDVSKLALKRATYRAQRFDSSSEPSIPREFYFAPEFDYKSADIAGLNQAYLEQLDYKVNPYLNSPEVMKESGFIGAPYNI